MSQPADAPLSGASYLILVANVAPLVRHADRLLQRARGAGVECLLEWHIEPRPHVLRDGGYASYCTSVAF